MKVIASNNAGSKLAASILATDTSLTLTAGTGATFASPGAGQYAVITIVDQGTGLIDEIIWYTARSGDVLSGLLRGQEGTTARAWAVYDPVAELWTAGQLAKLAQDPSDQLGGVSAVQVYAGNPNTHVAGNAAVVGTSAPSLVWDTTNKIFWTCTTTGNVAGAVWYPQTTPGQTFYGGTAGGTNNSLTITTTVPITLTAGVAVAFTVSATNTTATIVNVNGMGGIGIRKNSPAGLASTTGGELVAGNDAVIRYNGTFWALEVSTLGTASKVNVSSNTGIVAAVSGTVTTGNVAIFSDTAGTVTNGGPPNVGGAPFPLTIANAGQSFAPGIYFVDTTAGAFAITLAGPPTAGSGWSFIDQRGTWATNNFSVNAYGALNFVSSGLTFQTLAANLSGWEFSVEYDGTNFGLL